MTSVFVGAEQEIELERPNRDADDVQRLIRRQTKTAKPPSVPLQDIPGHKGIDLKNASPSGEKKAINTSSEGLQLTTVARMPFHGREEWCNAL